MARPRENFPELCSCGDVGWMRGGPTSVILVDAEDIHLLEAEPWHANPKGYIHARRSRKKLHRVILGALGSAWGDHKNRDKADCRKDNLRPCTRNQSVWNRGELKKLKTAAIHSRFKGVHWRDSGKWRARISVHGRPINLGEFHDEVEAALAYDAAAREHHGEFAATNF